MHYLAILGRQPELGLVELESLLGAVAIRPWGRHAVVNQPLELGRLGGVIKYGEVIYEGTAADLLGLEFDWAALVGSGGKRRVALSYYGVRVTVRSVLATGLELKKRLRGSTSLRLIAPTAGSEVSAAQLRHNDVLEHGVELLVAINGQQMVVARTLAVQDIDWYARRDYGRPARSAKVGMLPPKLAQILINTTPEGPVADPFCGTGVVLQEARLLGRRATGSDIAADMIAATEQNMAWLSQERPDLPSYSINQADARSVTLLPDESIVSEGYLGPHLTTPPSDKQLTQLRTELLDLYRAALTDWASQLDSGAELAFCVPAWRVGKGWAELGLVDELPDLGYTSKVFEHAKGRLLYARPDQIVGRQLILLRKN